MSEIERAFIEFRRLALLREESTSAQIARYYLRAWKVIVGELKRLDSEWRKAKAAGQKPDATWIYQYNRARSFHALVLEQMRKYSQYAGQAIYKNIEGEIAAADKEAKSLAVMRYKDHPEIMARWHNFDKSAVQIALGFGQPMSPLYRLLESISSDFADAAMDILIDGVLLGRNPKKTANLMREKLAITTSRALTIARTETLRARRYADRAAYQANSDIIEGWIWNAALDMRTCPACWAMHGTRHTNAEILDDHPNGRCAMMPAFRSWAEIGEIIGADFSAMRDDPPIKSGAAVFAALSASQQLEILGRKRYALWKSGALELMDFVGRKYSPVWGSVRFALSARAAKMRKGIADDDNS